MLLHYLAVVASAGMTLVALYVICHIAGRGFFDGKYASIEHYVLKRGRSPQDDEPNV